MSSPPWPQDQVARYTAYRAKGLIAIAGQDTYYEFKINSHGTVYEVLFVREEGVEIGDPPAQPKAQL